MGDSNIAYDVILQPGHYQRSSGRTGTEGKYISEQALVAYITNIIATNLHSVREERVGRLRRQLFAATAGRAEHSVDYTASCSLRSMPMVVSPPARPDLVSATRRPPR